MAGYYPFVALLLLVQLSCGMHLSETLTAHTTRNEPRNAKSVFQTCGTSTKENDTFFLNPSYPTSESVPQPNCQLNVLPMHSNICQIRLNFVEFTLAQPALDGVCDLDFMQVTGGSHNVPTLCGDLPGQHLYVEVNPSFSSVIINVDTSTVGALWIIEVSQIACDSVYKAPPGCLQYYTSTSGTVSSFNYLSSGSNIPNAATPRQLVNQGYGACILSRAGYCSVTWKKPDGEGNHYFTVSGDAIVVPPFPSTPAGLPIVGDACLTDYVIIPDGVITDTQQTQTSSDRFCGNGFPETVQSSVQPFALYVVTNEEEVASHDQGNLGFNLAYRMNPCA